MSIAEYNPFEGRRQIKFHVLFNLLQPLSHISETTGNESLLKTTQMTSIDGQKVQVPVYSGNAQRNGNMGRRTGIASFLDALDIAVTRSTHQTLYSGGYIEGSTINDFDIEERIRKLLPNLSLLGGAIPPETLGLPKGKSQMMEGRLNIGDAFLVCYESVPYLFAQCPALLPWEATESIESIMEHRRKFVDLRYKHASGQISRSEVSKAFAAMKQLEAEHLPIIRHFCKNSSDYWEFRESVRVPSFKQPELSRHMAKTAPKLIKGEATEKPQKEKKDAGRQMISGAWTIQRGAQLYAFWSSRGQGITSLEEGALVNTLLEFAKQPYLGGKANTGCGLVSVSIRYEADGEAGDYLTLSEGSQVISDRASECHQRYRDMVEVYQEHIAEIKAGSTVESSDALNLLGVGNATA
jgi:hypothetical protein